MQLKNKVEREKFLENYREWELWKEIPELELKLYRYAFVSTGAVIIATEYPCKKLLDFKHGHCVYGKGTGVEYSLILREGDNFKPQSYSDSEFLYYKPTGERKGTLLEYLQKVKPEI